MWKLDHGLSVTVYLALFLSSVSGSCIDLDLGMGNRKIPDSNITASSEKSVDTKAKNGRLNYTSGSSWCAGTNDTNPYLQIDLQTLHIICAVSTQGNSQADQWVKNYKLQLSTDGRTWTDYQEGGKIKVLDGNHNRNSEVKHAVYGVLTKYLRFLPQTHQGGVCMRTEVFGVKQKPMCYSQAIGVATTVTIPDSSLLASSEYDSVYAAKYGRLNNARSWAPNGNNNANDYLQIDLLFEYVICAVATQGNPRTREWTTKYKLQSSLDSVNFITYQENSNNKVFDGNSGQNDIVKHSLDKFTSARYIRFQPTAYSNYKGLRVEVYGIRVIRAPSQAPSSFTLTASSSTSITASWQLPSGIARNGRIQGFKLFFRKKGSAGSVNTLTINSGVTQSRVVTGLDKYTEYELQVLAFTSAGDGPKSSVRVKRTMEDVPSQPPSGVTVTAITSTIVRVSWQLPPVGFRNGIITGFKLFFKRKNFPGPLQVTTINNGTTNTKDFTGLVKYTEYEFQMLAFTAAGDGPKSSSLVERTLEDVPSQPPVGFTLTATTSTSIRASWQLPPEDSRNGDITGYKLFYKKRGISGPASMQSINNKATRTQEVTGLDKFTEYEFQILAFTSVGDGPNSTAVFEKTKEAESCIDLDLGMGNRKIPDSNIKASSEKSVDTKAKNGRLNYTSGSSWCAGTSDANPYLQIDLQTLHIICAVSTQGNFKEDQWVKTYMLQLSTDGTAWIDYKEDGQVKFLRGNNDRDSEMKHVVYGVLTKYLRFLPQTHHGGVCMRTEVFGMKQKPTCDTEAIGLASGGNIPDSSFTSSTYYDSSYKPSYARLNGNRRGWAPRTKTNPADYLQIDLLYEYIICAVATQGAKGIDEWTTKFKIQLSLDGTTFVTYGENNIDKLFTGNSNRDGIVKNSLQDFASAKFIRFQPTEYQAFKALRVEVYGILLTRVPSQPPTAFKLNATSSTSITASWQLPPVFARHGRRITGFKVFFKKKGSVGLANTLFVNSGSASSRNFTGLEKYTEYEFQILAFTSDGDGSKSLVKVERTKEDVPSRPPVGFTLTATTSTSIRASWQLPPEDSRNGDIIGYKLFYRKRGISGPTSMQSINDKATRTQEVTGLDKFTEYEFQILAFTSVGDGLNSTAVFEKTKEAAPSAPTSLSFVDVPPNNLHGPRVTLSWSKPAKPNGVIRRYNLFYSHDGGSPGRISGIDKDALSHTVDVLGGVTYQFHLRAVTIKAGPNETITVTTKEYAPSAPKSLSFVDVPPSNLHGPRVTLSWSKPAKPNGVIRRYNLFYSHDGGAPKESSGLDKDALSHTVDVLGGVTYLFHVRAVTIKPGPNETITVTTKEYAPSVGPEPVSPSPVNKTTFNISWGCLPRNESYGKVTLYEVKASFLQKENSRKRSVINDLSANTSATFVVLSDFELCSKYNVSVRAYTAAGAGPYGKPSELTTSRPEPPGDLRATPSGATHVTLTWKQNDKEEEIEYTVKYSGTKDYNETFKDDEKVIESKQTTTQRVIGLIPGTEYVFEVYGTSVCGRSISKTLSVTTDMMAPEAPVPHNMTDVEISKTAVDILLWPVEQKYGPISAYQVIVLKVVNTVEELPENYDTQLEAASDAKKDDVNFYIAAEIANVPVLVKPWKFIVGDGTKAEIYVNEELEKGQTYIVYERAVTDTTEELLKGEVRKVAKIAIVPAITGGGTKEKSSGSNAAAVAVPVVLLLLLIPAVVVAVFFYRRRRQSKSKAASERSVRFGDLKDDDENLPASTSDRVYQNVGVKSQSIKGVEQRHVCEEEEAVYSEADDGKLKPIPVADFAKYWKKNSENGAIVLREEYKNLPGGLQFAWNIGKSNRCKNRYGNIVSYDHSRVELEEIEGDKNSSYINASYIPTYDEVTITYIATQGPTSTTIADFWRMVWQESCSSIVMLTNLVELGKSKCDQYWPDDTFKYGAIRVTLQKTETFADYVIRSFIVTKDSEKRNVQQFHFETWPDKGVPQHSTALLGFRQKIHARHQATGGPLLVHCSAGVGRTGTYIAIDAMLEGAEKTKTVFIQNYVQVMRRSRPHMVQKDDQYVFLHQAVMEALVGGNTEIESQDLRVKLRKLAMVHKSSKKTGYEREFKRLELVTDIQASQEEAKEAFMPANVAKNRFPNIVPLDNARVFLQASSQEESYINASFVDDYRQRSAYILTQAPLDNTVVDFWKMISQYDIGTVVMLNNLKEGKQSYPQYWPSERSAKYGEITVRLLSQETSSNITTRKFSVKNAALSLKTSTLQHLQYTGWADRNSCPDPQEILDLMTAVQQSQQQSGNGVLVFQCSDGTGRSGCVAAIMSVIERVKIEQTVDVFQTVKLLRAKRSGAVNTVEQYMFCYKTVLAYLDSFSTYSNFAEC